jgi:hypothetical protein
MIVLKFPGYDYKPIFPSPLIRSESDHLNEKPSFHLMSQTLHHQGVSPLD